MKKIKKNFDIRIIRNRKNCLFYINQIHYLIEILNELNIKIERHKIINIFINNYNFIKFFKFFKFFDFFDECINVKNYQHIVEKIM